MFSAIKKSSSTKIKSAWNDTDWVDCLCYRRDLKIVKFASELTFISIAGKDSEMKPA